MHIENRLLFLFTKSSFSLIPFDLCFNDNNLHVVYLQFLVMLSFVSSLRARNLLQTAGINCYTPQNMGGYVIFKGNEELTNPQVAYKPRFCLPCSDRPQLLFFACVGPGYKLGNWD